MAGGLAGRTPEKSTSRC